MKELRLWHIVDEGFVAVPTDGLVRFNQFFKDGLVKLQVFFSFLSFFAKN